MSTPMHLDVDVSHYKRDDVYEEKINDGYHYQFEDDEDEQQEEEKTSQEIYIIYQEHDNDKKEQQQGQEQEQQSEQVQINIEMEELKQKKEQSSTATATATAVATPVTGDISLSVIWSKAKAGIKSNFIPGILLQSLAIFLVLLYYFVSSVQDGFNSLATFKDNSGILFSFFSTGICAGFLPCVIIALQRYLRARKGIFPQPDPFRPNPWAETAYLTIFWALIGIQVDYFYRAQALMFGSDASVRVIAAKVSFDQFVYSAFFSIHESTAVYLFKDCGFSWTEFRRRYGKKFLLLNIVPSLLGTWMVWIPACSIIYSLPSSLQIPLFNIVSCFYSICLTITAKN